MEDTTSAKVVFFKKIKKFDAGNGDLTGRLANARLYGANASIDEFCLGDFDPEYRDQAEVWDVKITVETI